MIRVRIFKSSFERRKIIQKKEHGPYLEVLATQASSVTVTVSGDENQRKIYCNF